MFGSIELFRKNKSGEHIEKKEEEDPPEDVDVFQISDFLRAKLQKVREEIETQVEATSVIPRLSERKERLEKDIHAEEEKITEIENLIPKLQQKKKGLQESVKRKQEEISRIAEIELILQKI